MSKQITIAVGAVNARLVNSTNAERGHIQQLLSYAEDGAEYSAAVRGGTWDGRNSFFDFATETFPAGFFVRVYKEFVRLGYAVNVVRKQLPAPLGPENPKVDDFPEDPRYDYQPEVSRLLLKYGQITAQVATGGGKSRIAKLCVQRLGRPTIFLTTRAILMHQMRDAFMQDLGVPVGIFGDDEWSETLSTFNVGMVQTFAARLETKTVAGEYASLLERRQTALQKDLEALEKSLKRKKVDPKEIDKAIDARAAVVRGEYPTYEQDVADLKVKVEKHQRRRAETVELLAKFEFLILEEAHEASSDSYYGVTRACTNAIYRLALTGTPNMRPSQKANLMLEACSGPVAIVISEKMLIDRGILATPYFVFAHDPSPFPEGEFEDEEGQTRTSKLFRATPYQRAYELGVTGGVWRNQRIVNEVARARDYGLTSLVLVLHKAHGKRLMAKLVEKGVRCAWIEGENSRDDRLAAIAALKAGKIDCLVGTNIMDVGVDVPAVGLIVLAGAGMAEVAIRQRIGRGARAKKVGPNVFFVLDFTDPVNNHLREHAQFRRNLVDTTPGFAQGVVADFPYDQFFKKAA